METDPSGDALSARLEAQPGGDASTWRPLLFRLTEAEDRRRLAELLNREAGARVQSSIRGQLEELMECRDPRVKNDAAERSRRVVAHLDGRPIAEYGCRVYFPWSRHLVQVLPEAEFREVRASRNRYKITVEEQARLRSFTIGVVGLSVGQAIAMAMALEGCAGSYRLADFDHLALSNLNRLACGIADLGLNKAILSARRLLEVDPFLDVRVLADGVSEGSVDAFLTEGGRLDLLVEECDDLFMKVHLRERARALRVPVLMETNDRGMLDIERFDLEPDRELFHGLVGPVRAKALKGLPTKEKVPFVLKILGDMSPRLAASLVEIDQTITSWPQLGSGAMLGGAVAADAARRLLLGELRASGRFHVDLHELVRDTGDAVAAGGTEPAPPPEDPPEAATAALVSAGPGPVSTEQVLHLVSSAVLAPSGGNCQPWKFVWLAEGRLRCLHDVDRSASFLDFEHRAAYLALGAAVENVVIAAAAIGLEAEVAPFPGRDLEHVCDVAFAPRERSGGTDEGLAPFIPLRATNRRLGARRPLAQDDLAKLRAALGDPAAELQVLTETGQLDEMGLVLGAGDRFRFFDERLYREMMAEMRWNPRHAAQTRDGVDIATLEFGDVDEAGLRLLSSWPVVRFLRSMGIGGALEDLSRRAVESASAMALVTYGGTSPLDYFLGGRAMQRVWLTATALGLAVQPMSSLPYLFARLERGAGFEPREREVLRGLRERYARLFRVGPQTGELLLFRLARVEAPTVRSLRRPAAAVLSFA
jgi:nitroreductase